MEKTFPQRIYHLVSLIPSGKVSTYGQLALLAGSPRSARIVGAALAKAPAGLPCHRVLYRDGTLCCDQAFGGKDVQRKLLEQGIPAAIVGKITEPAGTEIYVTQSRKW